MVISSLKYCKTLRANLLEPEVYHLNPKKSDTVQFRKFVRLVVQYDSTTSLLQVFFPLIGYVICYVKHNTIFR